MACEYLEKTQDQQLNIVEALNKTRCETRYELKHRTYFAQFTYTIKAQPKN